MQKRLLVLTELEARCYKLEKEVKDLTKKLEKKEMSIEDINQALAKADEDIKAGRTEPAAPVFKRLITNAKIGDLVKDGQIAQFVCYRDGDLWYKVGHTQWSCDEQDGGACQGFFEFAVPVSDTGSGVFPAEIKAITLMRWIRKEIERQEAWQKKAE